MRYNFFFLLVWLTLVSCAGNAQVIEPVEVAGWERRAPLLEANSEMAVAQLGDSIYVLGGYPSSRQTVSTVQVYDAATDSWSLAPPLPKASNHNMATAVLGKLYVIGGQTEAQGSGPFINDVYEFDPATQSWTEKAPMPTIRSGGATAVIDNKIYVAGGRPPQGHHFAVYDPVADEWTTLPDMPTARNHLIAAAIEGKVYVFGGRFGAGFRSEVTDIVEIYDPQTNSWSSGTSMLTPRSGMNGIVANDCFHLLGGEGNGAGNVNGLYPQHDVYNPTTDSWTRLADMPTPVHGVVGMALIGNWIHFPGGGVAQGGSSGNTIHQVFQADLSC